MQKFKRMKISHEKSKPGLLPFSKDHYAGALFCWKIRQGLKFHIEKQRMLDYVNYFWSHYFSDHFKEEEEILFGLVKDNEVQKALADHQQIKTVFKKIEISGLQYAEDILLELSDTIDSHIRFEERILFPHLCKALSDKQLRGIGDHLVREPLVDDYQDQFWIKSKSL